ncbi:hypothetical protein JW992_16255, partial [candidate division KSB1 bacterium]|nr:hypothetical protein [candidate division KSB1 bacterium]
INTHMVRRVDFYAGAFPARYGDRASSVMDISLREGARDRYAGHGYLGMAGAGVIAEGPLASSRGSFIISARKSFLDLIISSTGLTAVPKYWNMQGKVVTDINSNNRLTLNAITGNDEITIEDETTGYTRGAENVRSLSNQYAIGATLRTLYGTKGFSQLTVSQVRNHWDQYVYYNDNRPYYTNISNEIERTARTSVTWLPIRAVEIQSGVQVKWISADISEWAEPDTLFIHDLTVIPPQPIAIARAYDLYQHDSSIHSHKAAAWLHGKWQLFSPLALTAGLRWDQFDYTGHSILDPRLGLNLKITRQTALNLAYGCHSQSPAYVQLTAHPLNRDLDYKSTRQLVAGLDHLFRDDIRGTIELFYKDYRGVPLSASSLTPDPLDSGYGRLVNRGKGNARGIELFLQKKLVQNYSFILSYAYSVAKGYDPRYDIEYDWHYDYRHILTLITGARFQLHNHRWYQELSQKGLYKAFAWILPFADELEFGLRWRYLGGRPYTSPRYYPEYQRWLTDENILYNDRRYPHYHRLDLRVDRRFMFNNWNMVTFFDLVNVYGRDNIWAYSYEDDGTIETIYQYKLFPVGGLTIEF